MSFCSMFLFFSVMSLLDHPVPVAGENCADKPVFTPSKLVVKYGDSASARCSVCQHACQTSLFGLEIPVGVTTRNETTKTISWTVDSLTEWDIPSICYYNNDAIGAQCSSTLPLIVYQPPDKVSISFAGHNEQMYEDHQYTLQCEVQHVAPVGHLTVTFYRGQTALEPQLRSNNTQEKKPVSETFTLNITPSKEHDGGQYWCKAELDLGSEGPQPPVVKSLTIAATVFYKPHLKGSSHSHSIIVTEGSPLQLNCSAVGNPSPSYTWTVPGHSSSNSNILTIDSVTSADKGQFICLARNNMGNVTVVFNVEVQVDYTIYIILAVVIAAVVCIIVATVVYMNYYKHHRMGKYNPKDVFRFSKQHSLVPTA